MSPRQSFVVSVVSGLTIAAILALVSAMSHDRLHLPVVGVIAGAAIICGLAVLSVLSWRRHGQLQCDLDRLERGSWPPWMYDIAAAALAASIRVFREGQFVVFERADGKRHPLVAEPSGGLGRALEPHRALEVLSGWGVGVRTGSRGQLLPGTWIT